MNPANAALVLARHSFKAGSNASIGEACSTSLQTCSVDWVRFATSDDYPTQVENDIWFVHVNGRWTMLYRVGDVHFGTGNTAAVFVDARGVGMATVVVTVELIDEANGLFCPMNEADCANVFVRYVTVTQFVTRKAPTRTGNFLN